LSTVVPYEAGEDEVRLEIDGEGRDRAGGEWRLKER
jgi:hypothetical protein